MSVVVLSDELRLGVKGFTDHELAGSPRNTFWRDPLSGHVLYSTRRQAIYFNDSVKSLSTIGGVYGLYLWLRASEGA